MYFSLTAAILMHPLWNKFCKNYISGIISSVKLALEDAPSSTASSAPTCWAHGLYWFYRHCRVTSSLARHTWIKCLDLKVVYNVHLFISLFDIAPSMYTPSLSRYLTVEGIVRLICLQKTLIWKLLWLLAIEWWWLTLGGSQSNLSKPVGQYPPCFQDPCAGI